MTLMECVKTVRKMTEWIRNQMNMPKCVGHALKIMGNVVRKRIERKNHWATIQCERRLACCEEATKVLQKCYKG